RQRRRRRRRVAATADGAGPTAKNDVLQLAASTVAIGRERHVRTGRDDLRAAVVGADDAQAFALDPEWLRVHPCADDDLGAVGSGADRRLHRPELTGHVQRGAPATEALT